VRPEKALSGRLARFDRIRNPLRILALEPTVTIDLAPRIAR
jgi:hypothetical protein